MALHRQHQLWAPCLVLCLWPLCCRGSPGSCAQGCSWSSRGEVLRAGLSSCPGYSLSHMKHLSQRLWGQGLPGVSRTLVKASLVVLSPLWSLQPGVGRATFLQELWT